APRRGSLTWLRHEPGTLVPSRTPNKELLTACSPILNTKPDRFLPKVEVASSNLVSRSKAPRASKSYSRSAPAGPDRQSSRHVDLQRPGLQLQPMTVSSDDPGSTPNLTAD